MLLIQIMKNQRLWRTFIFWAIISMPFSGALAQDDKKPEPVVKVHELADSSVNFVVRPWVATDNYWDVYWDITRAVKDRFDAEGVSIPFPQRDIHVYQTASQRHVRSNFKISISI